MKLLHIGDLHIGKRVNGFSLLEDQKHILNQILETIKSRKIDGLLIAGDIYDTTTPSSEAMDCFDNFISEVHSLGISCFAVSGNHDNVYRVSFGSNIMAKENIYFAKKYSGQIKPIEVQNGICIWLLPFIRPFDVRVYYPNFASGSYEEMMGTVIKNLEIDKSKTNILVAHQFVTCNGKTPERSESESVSLGTLDNIDASNFDDFDYVALGHIHKPQPMGKKTVRYSGSPLKYSFSEKNDKKSMVLLNISNGKIDLELIPFAPIRDMKEFVGTFEELSKLPKTEDYARIILKDETANLDVKHKLETIFPNVMEIIYDNAFTRKNNKIKNAEFVETQSPLELFKLFYKEQNNKEMEKEQLETVEEIFESLRGNE